jgi:hypothetical protein
LMLRKKGMSLSSISQTHFVGNTFNLYDGCTRC